MPDMIRKVETGLSPDADQARRLYRQRRERDEAIGGELFGEPAWDLLLALYVARSQNRPVSALSASVATSAPLSVTCRWLSCLEEHGLVEFPYRSPEEGATLVTLSDEGFARMTMLLSELR